MKEAGHWVKLSNGNYSQEEEDIGNGVTRLRTLGGEPQARILDEEYRHVFQTNTIRTGVTSMETLEDRHQATLGGNSSKYRTSQGEIAITEEGGEPQARILDEGSRPDIQSNTIRTVVTSTETLGDRHQAAYGGGSSISKHENGMLMTVETENQNLHIKNWRKEGIG